MEDISATAVNVDLAKRAQVPRLLTLAALGFLDDQNAVCLRVENLGNLLKLLALGLLGEENGQLSLKSDPVDEARCQDKDEAVASNELPILHESGPVLEVAVVVRRATDDVDRSIEEQAPHEGWGK